MSDTLGALVIAFSDHCSLTAVNRPNRLVLAASILALLSARPLTATLNSAPVQSVFPEQSVIVPRSGIDGGRQLFVRPPANLDDVAAITPRGNVNPPGGHVRPVKHMYLEYPIPKGGGAQAVQVSTMAGGEIVLLLHRQTEGCVQPVGNGCASGAGATQLIDEYQIWVRHTDQVTSYYDHLHQLDARLGLPDWRDSQAGWVSVGKMRILLLGLNGARPPVSLGLAQRLGSTRNYFHAWDVGVVDTRRTNPFLASGVLRYPSLPELLNAFRAEGGPGIFLSPGQPFPGEMFVNSASFIDYMPERLAREWRKKLGGDGSGGRPDWDLAGTLQGNWYRAGVTVATFANMRAIEENAISLSPYNLDPVNRVQIGIGGGFFTNLPTTTDVIELKIREQLSRGLQLAAEVGGRQNPRPSSVSLGSHACYSIPVETNTFGLLVYHQNVAGIGHLRLKYLPESCTAVLATIDSNPAQLDAFAWAGDYVR